MRILVNTNFSANAHFVTDLVNVYHDNFLHGLMLERFPCCRSFATAANENLARVWVVKHGWMDQALVVHPFVGFRALQLAI